ncbi:serine/threonine-protein kinase [Polyangium fumosum]|uniref:Serine/threonine protein kinase n=1 Tax=Polyangium fumosum TaxID=889272 RepID=A0A4U1JH29_9BACT|nr:serine/threonine-protein kinase [Polyangium fumosum]TKD10461.1 serine/threonine protein kinase [Polyangium fumosum]
MAPIRPEQAPADVQADVPAFRPGTVVDGRYRVLRLIGGGGNGLVHEVEHVRTGQRLALKSLLDPTTYQRLEQEARATSLLKSPRAVKIVDMGMSQTEGPYLVMELLAGQSLRELLHEAGQLPLELTVNVALQVGECLAEAHTQGIVHRDLKPDNIHLGPGPSPGVYDVKLLDFGIVKIASDAPVPGGSLTRTGSTVGTPYYMSLEQLRNPSGVDGRSDLYSLGVVLYECLTGRKPYDADTIGDLVFALCSGPPTDIARLRPDLPQPVGKAIMRALAPDRDDRQGGVLDLCRDLAPFGDRSLSAWMHEPQRPAAPEPPRPSHAGPFGGAPTPSGLRSIPSSEATQAFPLPDGPVPPIDELTPSLPSSPGRDDDDEPGERRDTPTTFYVKPELPESSGAPHRERRYAPEPPERMPDSEKTRMLVEPSRGQRQYAIPSENIDDPPTAPVKPGDLAFGPGNKYAKTAPIDASQFPELQNLPPLGPYGAPNPGGFGAPTPTGSGVYAAPPPGMMGQPGMPPGMFRPPPMPGQLMTSQSNLPAVNIPGTTGPLPMGPGAPPPWMTRPGQPTQAPPPPAGGGLAALVNFWQNAPPRTQLAIAVGSASGLVALLLILLWIVVR